MRRHVLGAEGQPVGVELSSAGQMIQEEHAAKKSMPQVQVQSIPGDCDLDFPLGTENSNTCADNSNLAHYNFSGEDRTFESKLIMQETLCGLAGTEWDAKAGGTNFKVVNDDNAPRGCFEGNCSDASFDVGDKVKASYQNSVGKYNCTIKSKNTDGSFEVDWEHEGATGDTTKSSGDLEHRADKCFFYNEIGDLPTSPKGHPVCFRAKFLKGKKDTNGGCPEPSVYSVITDEDTCLKAANCMGHCTDTEFKVTELDASEYDNYPIGCFIHNPSSENLNNPCIAFNPPKLDVNAPSNEPSNPQGTPVCNTTTVGR